VTSYVLCVTEYELTIERFHDMPLDPISVGGIVRTALLSAGLVGKSSGQLSLGLSNALCMYGKTGMAVSTIDVGTLGVGKGIGVGVLLAQPVLAATLASSLSAGGIIGLSAVQLVSGISTGYSMALAAALINTAHPSVGVGTGKLQIMPNTVVAISIFNTAFKAAGLVGPSSIPLATAIAKGLDMALPSAIGFVAIAGSPNIIPSAGIGSGKLL